MKPFQQNINASPYRFYLVISLLPLLYCFLFNTLAYGQTETHIRKRLEVGEGISPKSIVSSGNGLFSAQNMMYRHSITLYNAEGNRLAKIPDKVNLRKFGFSDYSNEKQYGAPVESVFTKDGKYLWVSNYHMSGSDFKNPGCDHCIGQDFDPSFLYKINTTTFEIENAVKVGSVPKFLSISSDEKTLIVSNWVSSDISIIDLDTETEIKRVTVGAHPRGIAITEDSKRAYVTIMGSTKIAEVNLESYEVQYITEVGKAPRSLLLADSDSTLYISLNSSNEILKYNRHTKEKKYCKTLAGPRSMTLSPDEKSLYIVNYFDDVFTKINTDSMHIMAEIPTGPKPIGICANWRASEIWVACYSGTIEIFKDFQLDRDLHTPPLFGFQFPDFTIPPSITTESKISSSSDLDSSNITDTIIEAAPAELTTTIIQVADLKNHQTQPIEKNNPNNKLENSEGCQYHVIVGAFAVSNNAETRKNELLKEGFPAQIIIGKQLNYVSVQCFLTREAATEGKILIQEKLQDSGTPWILKR